MKNKQIKKHFLLATVIVIGFLTSCSSTKSATPVTTQSSTPLILNTDKPLAQCNQTTDSNFQFNTSVYTDQSGSVNSDWIKIKFSYLSADVTANNNVIRFYKWRVVAGASQLDSTPLQFATYNLSTGQITSAAMSSINANQITQTTGIYIQLNDPSGVYQVIKPVAYNSAGTVVAQVNSLIPSFYASPEDYKYNSDGSARATLLQQLHKLYGVNVSAYTSQQLTETFSQYCF